MAWLVTGGAGYIGAHVVRALQASGREVVVLDDLSTGSAHRVPVGVPLVRGEIRSRRAVRRALSDTGRQVTGVVHLATRRGAAPSVREPLRYWSQNVGGLQVLLEELLDAGVRQVVLGSSSAVYGRTLTTLDSRTKVTESLPTDPATPLGGTHWAAEQMLAAAAHAYEWKALSLRLFTVGGAGAPSLGPTSTEGLIGRILTVRGEGKRPQVYGEDFPTPDGSLVRDIVHVNDVAAAFVQAVRVVEAAHLAALTSAEAASAVRAAGERVQSAATRAEHEARKLPGVGLAAGMASGVPAAAEAASIVAARALERLPGASRALELAADGLDGALGSVAGENLRGQVTGVAAQLGSLVAKVAGVEDGPRLTDYLAVNIGTGRGHSAFDVVEALRGSVGDPFAVDIVARRAGDPAYVVAATDLAASLLGWRARLSLREVTDSAWAAWQHDHPTDPSTTP
jgi:UDP-glucose 4-epimerase